MVDQQPKLASEMAAAAIRTALAAQLALTGELVAALVANGGLTKQEAAEMINKLADTISSSLESSPSDLQAVFLAPMREHAEALRNIAADLKTPI
jgi:hypothetical protein